MKTLPDFWTEKGVDAATQTTLAEFGLGDRDALEGVTARDLKEVYGIAPAMIARVIAARTEYDKWLAAATAPFNIGTTEDAFTALGVAPTNPEVLAATDTFRETHGFLPSVDPAQPFDVAATIEAYAWVAARPGRRLPTEWKGSTGVPAKFRTWAELFPAEKGRFHPLRPTEELSPASPLFAISEDDLLALHFLAADGKLWAGADDEDLVDRVTARRAKFQGAVAEVARLKAAGGTEWLQLLRRLHGEVGTPATPPFASSPAAPPTDGEFWGRQRLWGDHPAWNAPLSAYVNGAPIDGLAPHIALRLRLRTIVAGGDLARFVADFAAGARTLAALRGDPNATQILDGLTVDTLEGTTLDTKVLSLIQYCQRRRQDRALWLAAGGLDDLLPPPPPVKPLAPPTDLAALVETLWPYKSGATHFNTAETADLIFRCGYATDDFGADTPRELGKALVRRAAQDNRLGYLIKAIWTERGDMRQALKHGGWDRLL